MNSIHFGAYKNPQVVTDKQGRQRLSAKSVIDGCQVTIMLTVRPYDKGNEVTVDVTGTDGVSCRVGGIDFPGTEGPKVDSGLKSKLAEALAKRDPLERFLPHSI